MAIPGKRRAKDQSVDEKAQRVHSFFPEATPLVASKISRSYYFSLAGKRIRLSDHPALPWLKGADWDFSFQIRRSVPILVRQIQAAVQQ